MTRCKWIKWNGGKCPVAKGTETEIQFRNGTISRTHFPQTYFWDHCPGQHDIDVVAYRWHRPSWWRRLMSAIVT